MYKTVQISDEELIEFVAGQDDSKQINMNEPNTADPCGCLLIQFAKTRFGFDGSAAAGWESVTGKDGDDIIQMNFPPMAGRLVRKLIDFNRTNYRHVKKLLQADLNSGLFP